MVELKSYPAKNGDAFLVNATDRSFCMLVDGGYAETCSTYLEPDLELLAAKGRWLDLVVATHVDADHNLDHFFRTYNEQRPHSAFGDAAPRTPMEVYRQTLPLAINQ